MECFIHNIQNPISECKTAYYSRVRDGTGLCEPLCDALNSMGWTNPTPIQVKAIPAALNGRDIVGLAQAGSGKTGAYLLPIIQRLLQKPKPVFAVILCPSRELVVQTVEVCHALGHEFGLQCLSLVGGQNAEMQAKEMKKKKFHIIVGTPGRVAYHIAQSKVLNVSKVNYLVIDEADQFVTDRFQAEVSIILEHINEKRKTFLFSATMCSSTEKLELFGMKDPCQIEVDDKYSKAEKLDHAFIFLPDDAREVEVVQLLRSANIAKGTHKSIIFVNNWRDSFRIAEILNVILFNNFSPDNKSVLCMHGKMKQDERQNVLAEFKSGNVSIIVATDLAARGLDIPLVDLVINFDLPVKSTWSDCAKAYVHRIGRTGRAGRTGRSVSLVTPYTANYLKIIESNMGEQVPQMTWTPLPSAQFNQMKSEIKSLSSECKAQLKEQDEPSKKRRKKMPKTKAKKMKK